MNRNDQDQLLSYLDGNLSNEEKRRIEFRLLEDADLRRELEYLKQIQQALKRKPVEPSPGIWENVEARIQDDSQDLWSHLEWAGKRLVPLFAAAAVVMLAVLASPNGEELEEVTLDSYFADQEGLVLSEFEGSTQNILGIEETETLEPDQVTQ